MNNFKFFFLLMGIATVILLLRFYIAENEAPLIQNGVFYFGDSHARFMGGEGIDGEKSWQGLKRLGFVLDNYDMDTIVYSSGIVDLLNGEPDWMILGNVRQAAWLAQKADADFFVLGLFLTKHDGLNERIVALNPQLASLAEQEGFGFIDSAACVSEEDLVNELHLNAEGYRKLKECGELRVI